MLLVIAIISILAGLVISNISNAATDTRDVVARQQLAVVQEAVNHWVNREIGRVTTSGGSGKTVAQVMAEYNATTNVTNRYGLFSKYLDDATTLNFSIDDSQARLSTQAMRDVNKYLALPAWGNGSYPKVQLLP
jgi:type II secretory pathway pseudopilin PulG